MDLKPLNHTVEMESEIFLLFFLKSSTFQTFYNQKLRIHRFWSAKIENRKNRGRECSKLYFLFQINLSFLFYANTFKKHYKIYKYYKYYFL